MKFFLFSALILILSGCSESTAPDEQDIAEKNALIYWQGAYAVDGCGFFVEIDGKMYKPDNEEVIPEKYKDFNAPKIVRLKFKYLDEKVTSLCGDSPYPYKTDGVQIIEIDDFAASSLIGEWEWVESYGGIAGVTLVPENQGYTQTYDFTTDSTLSIYRNDTLINETTYKMSGDTLRIAGFDIWQIVAFKTDRIILYDQCIDCFINVYERKGVDPELVRTVGSWYNLNLQSDPVEIKDISVEGDILNLDVGYSGCVGHDFEVFTPAFFMESNPVQARLELYHKSSYDMCPVYSNETISFNLTPLKEKYREYYGDGGEIKLNLYVMGDSIKFATQPIYEF